LRLTPRGREIGLVDDERWERFQRRKGRFTRNLDVVSRASVTLSTGTRTPAARALQQPDVRLRVLADEGQLTLELDANQPDLDLPSVETEFKYEGSLRRELDAIARSRRQESRPIPTDLVFEGIPGLSREMVQRLTEVQPATLGQASRIPGMTP